MPFPQTQQRKRFARTIAQNNSSCRGFAGAGLRIFPQKVSILANCLSVIVTSRTSPSGGKKLLTRP